MTIAYFLEAAGAGCGEARLADGLRRARDSSGLEGIDLFTPARCTDPFLNDGPGPAHIVQWRFAVRADYANFPPFCGPVTHFPMRRITVV